MESEKGSEDIAHLYADITACLAALCDVLDAKGIATLDELREAFDRQALTKAAEARPYALLRSFATHLGLPPRTD